MPEPFYATHTIADTFVREHTYPTGVTVYFDMYGTRVKWGKDALRKKLPETLLIEWVDPPAPIEPEVSVVEKPSTVMLHADAARTVLHAAVWPEWACATGSASSPRGDDATVMNKRGPNGEKVVRICVVGPNRVSEFHEVLVPEFITFEVCK
jgi:hypothetical protein